MTATAPTYSIERILDHFIVIRKNQQIELTATTLHDSLILTAFDYSLLLQWTPSDYLQHDPSFTAFLYRIMKTNDPLFQNALHQQLLLFMSPEQAQLHADEIGTEYVPLLCAELEKERHNEKRT